MDKICAILLPLVILFGGLFAVSHLDLVSITNWPLLILTVVIANSIVVVKVMLSDYVKTFEMDSHCVQLTEMALTAFLATLAIQLFNHDSILQMSMLPYPFLHVLIVGLTITVVTTAIAAIIIKKLKNNEWPNNARILSIGYLVGFTGYAFYVALFMLKVVSK